MDPQDPDKTYVSADIDDPDQTFVSDRAPVAAPTPDADMTFFPDPGAGPSKRDLQTSADAETTFMPEAEASPVKPTQADAEMTFMPEPAPVKPTQADAEMTFMPEPTPERPTSADAEMTFMAEPKPEKPTPSADAEMTFMADEASPQTLVDPRPSADAEMTFMADDHAAPEAHGATVADGDMTFMGNDGGVYEDASSTMMDGPPSAVVGTEVDADMTFMPDADAPPASLNTLEPPPPTQRPQPFSGSASVTEEAFTSSINTSTELRTTRLRKGRSDEELFAGKYRLLGEIARGGMGVVHRALQVDLNQKVALKVMLAGSYASTSAKRRFLFEAEAAARLRHPNIVPVFDMGSEGENLYFTMALVSGDELKERRTALDRSQLLDVMIQVCDGVDYAHKKGIIHRDLKPGNVMMNEDNVPLIMDFGLAKQLSDAADEDDELEETDVAMTLDGSVMGTPHFMSPEQAAGKVAEVDTRTDVYALGVMLFQLWTNEYPYTGSGQEIVAKILTEEPPTPRDLDPTIDMDLEAVILKAMEREVGKRYDTAGDLKKDLERFRAGLPVSARRATVFYRVGKWAKRNRSRLSMAAAVFVVAALGVGGVVQQRAAEEARKEQAVQDRLDGAEAGLAALDADRAVFTADLDAFLSGGQSVAERKQRAPTLLARLTGDDGLVSRLAEHERSIGANVETHPRARVLQQRVDQVRAGLAVQVERLEVLRQVHAELERATQGLQRARQERDQALATLTVDTEPAPDWVDLPSAEAAGNALLAASREDETLGPEGAAFTKASAALDASLNQVRQSVFTAIRRSPGGAPEAEAAQRHLDEGNSLRASVDTAAARAAGTRLAKRLLSAARSLNLLLTDLAPTHLDEVRGRRLRVANLARALVQRGLEADRSVKGLSDALLTANFVHAQALLGLKAYRVFDVRLDDAGAFRPEQREALVALRKKVLEETHALRAKLEGGGLRINVLTGKVEVKGAGQTSGRTLLALKMRLGQLRRLASHPYMDDELERLRVASQEKVAETVKLVEVKYAREKLSAALEAARAEVEKVPVTDRPGELDALLEVWQRAERLLERGYARPLPAEEKEAHRRTCVLVRAELNHEAARSLADSDRVRARVLLDEAKRLYDSLPAEAVPENVRQSLSADAARLEDSD